MTIDEFSQVWAQSKRAAGTAKERSIADDLRNVRHFSAACGKADLAEIDSMDVVSAYARIKEGGLSQTTLNHIHISLKSMMRTAVSYGVIDSNPCDPIKAPRRGESERRSLTEEEAAALKSTLDQEISRSYDQLRLNEQRRSDAHAAADRRQIAYLSRVSRAKAVRAGLATGARLGEILALTWGNVDLDSKKLRIPSSKTRSGVRAISIGRGMVSDLRKWKIAQRTLLRKIGMEQCAATPVFCSNAGTFLSPSNFWRWWDSFRAENGFEGLKFHELRHTQATILLANGTDIKTAQNRLGHAKSSTMLDWYAHVIPQKDEEAAQLIEDIMG